MLAVMLMLVEYSGPNRWAVQSFGW